MAQADIIKFVEALHSGQWTARRDAAQHIGRLAFGDLPENVVREVIDPLVKLSADENWQVRIAAIEALINTGHVDVINALEAFENDPNHYVQAALKRGRKVLRKRTSPVKDKKVEAIFQALEAIDSKRATKSELLDLAMSTGERYYEELASDTAHVLNGRLNSLMVYFSELKKAWPEQAMTSATEQLFERINYYAADLGKVVADLTTYSQSAKPTFTRINLKSLLETSLELAKDQVRRSIKLEKIQISFSVSESLDLDGDRDLLEAAFTNLISNAFDAMPKAGSLTIVGYPDKDDLAHVEIVDNGVGMTDEQLERAHQRFKTTKKKNGGTGLGLPIAEKVIASAHGGRLEIESAPKKGTKVVVELPICQSGKNEL